MKCIIRAIDFDLINDIVVLFVRCRFVKVSGDFYRYMKHHLCCWNSGLVQVGELVWRFDSDKAVREDGCAKAAFLSHIIHC